MIKEGSASTTPSNEEVCKELVKQVTSFRRKIPKRCAEIERDCKQFEIDLQLNAPHEPLFPPDEIVCNLPDEETKQYIKSLSEKQENTDEICKKMESAIDSLQEAAILYRLKKRSENTN